ncbi:MAG: response regulator transcription factor [Anaerolineae bacterium]
MSGKYRVMLVDDHALILDGLTTLFSSVEDIEVVLAIQDASQVIYLLDRCAVDLLILDIEMPYHGFDVLQEVRQRYVELRVLMLTGYTDHSHVQMAIALGADGLVYKTEVFTQLLNAIRQIAQGKLIFPRCARPLLNQNGQEADTDLSPRELDVLALIARGLTNSEIARKLDISVNTVGYHLKNIFLKIKVNNRTEATVWYFANRSSFS